MDLSICAHGKATDTCHICHHSSRMETCIIHPCPSCAHKESMYQEAHRKWADLSDENLRLREFRCRVNEAFRAIQNDVSYSQKVKLETEIYGSFSCPHEGAAKRLQDAVDWACLILDGARVTGIHASFTELFRDELRRRAKEG